MRKWVVFVSGYNLRASKGDFIMKKLVIVFTVMLMLAGMGAAYASGYLLNTQSGKFHYASCRTIKHPNSAKFVPVESREEAIAQGYQPCGVCKP